MTQVIPHAQDGGSRLVQFLSDLMGMDARMSHKNFAQRLGQQIDLSDSFTLSESLRGLSKIKFEQTTAVEIPLKEEFLNERAKMVESIIKSFVADAASMQFNLLVPDEEIQTGESAAYKPYLKFYAMLQSDMEYKVQKLRVRVRRAVSGVSMELAQLAALDEALGNTLAVQMRKMFTVIPALLGKRFYYLRDQYQQNITSHPDSDNPELKEQPDDWMEQFYQEMQGLLLAELDVRLQPVLGLVEALDEEVEKKK